MMQRDDLSLGTDVHANGFMFHDVRVSARSSRQEPTVPGDGWCETFIVSRHVIALSIGVVSGRGPDPNSSAQRIRECVKDAALHGLGPSQTLRSANHVVRQLQGGVRAAACFALLDIRRGELRFANAGNPPPLMVGPSGSASLAFGKTALALGTEPTLQPVPQAVRTSPATLLVFYTNGVIVHGDYAVRGEHQLLEAAMFAYRQQADIAADTIGRLMASTGFNRNGASILTVRMPAVVNSKTTQRNKRMKRTQNWEIPPFRSLGSIRSERIEAPKASRGMQDY